MKHLNWIWRYIKQLFNLKQALPILFLIIGVLMQCAYAFDWFSINKTETQHFYKFLEKSADVILVSALVSFLMNSIEYMGFFKKELEKIIYSESFLDKRKDIERIWINVSKALFQAKFPQIQEPLLLALKNYYRPDSEEDIKLSYYHDYRTLYTLTIDETNPDIIHIVDKSRFTLNIEDSKEYHFPLKFWTCVSKDNQKDIEQVLTQVRVNGVIQTPKAFDPIYDDDSGTVCFQYSILLKGKKEYNIEYETTSKQFLSEDNYLAFRAKWLVMNMRVQVFHPENLDILFVNRAVENGFTVNDKRSGYREYEHKGIILKHQGYVMILNKRNQQLNNTEQS